MQGVDLELFRDIPGYKAILKAVLKSQIQVLVEQLAVQTGEESVLITACIEEGTLSHLGSDIGKVFMESQDDIKSRFLGFCLKRYQIKKQTGFYTEITRKKGPNNRRKLAAPHVRQRNPHRIIANTPSVNKKSRNLNLIKYTSAIQPNQSKSDYLFQNIERDKSLRTKEINSETVEGVLIKAEPRKLSDSNYVYEKTGNQSSLSGSNTDRLVIQNDVFLSTEPVKNEQEVEDWEPSDNHVNGNETGTQPLFAENKEDQQSSFVVLTEEGENVFEGQMGNKDATATNSVKDASSENFVHMKEEHYVSSEFNQTVVKSENDNDLSAFLNSDPSFAAEDSDNMGFSSHLETPSRSRRKVSKSGRKKMKMKMSLVDNDEDERPYPCSSCPKRFKERHHLTYHLRTHSGQRPYRCDICNKSFTQTSSLNTHRKTHLNEISCGMCGKTFKKASSFSGHVCYTTEKLD